MAHILEELLAKKRTVVLERWTDLIYGTYPADTTRFLRSVSNSISNPVGSSISDNCHRLYDWVVCSEQTSPDCIAMFLDNIVRIRAVQEFSASGAVEFVFLLKVAVREVLYKEIRRQGLFEELAEFEQRVDRLALLAFDNYSRCREQLHQIRANEIRNRTSRLFERVCQKYGMPSEW